MTRLSLSQARAQAAERQAISLKLKQVLVDCLALERESADIPDDCLLFGVGLGLDSVDALEIVVAIESEFDLRVENEHMKEIRSINSIVDFIQSEIERKKEDA